MEVLLARGHHPQTLPLRLSHTVAADTVVEVGEAGEIGTVAVDVRHSTMTALIVLGVDHRKVVGAPLVSGMTVMPTVTWSRTCDLVMLSGTTVNRLYGNHPAILEISETLATPSTATSARASIDKVLWPTSHKPPRRVSRLHHRSPLLPRPLAPRPSALRPHLTFLLKHHLRHPGRSPKTVKTDLFLRGNLLATNGHHPRGRPTPSVPPYRLALVGCSSKRRRARLVNSGSTLH